MVGIDMKKSTKFAPQNTPKLYLRIFEYSFPLRVQLQVTTKITYTYIGNSNIPDGSPCGGGAEPELVASLLDLPLCCEIYLLPGTRVLTIS